MTTRPTNAAERATVEMMVGELRRISQGHDPQLIANAVANFVAQVIVTSVVIEDMPQATAELWANDVKELIDDLVARNFPKLKALRESQGATKQ